MCLLHEGGKSIVYSGDLALTNQQGIQSFTTNLI